MQMELLWILIISVINVILMSVSMTIFLIKGYEHIVFENIIKLSREKGNDPDTEPLIIEQMRTTIRKFNKSFIILESSIIFYFIFWCTLLYFNIVF